MTGGAVISDCGLYRYRLWRDLVPSATTTLLFVMLNPSTADATIDDPTIRRCIGYARAFRLDRIAAVNLYAARATEPRRLADFDDPVGPDNDAHIGFELRRATSVACAWGATPAPGKAARIQRVREIHAGIPGAPPLRCLGATKAGDPKHPLYLPANADLVEWRPTC